ncbi:hypothetical protein AOL_s00054g936 [Orbilia oligospora ATCC 24927]|uniref:NACHT domain-containing protein n=1 Tax=Arthrobotrys oligospora (strain ATCC 24927 / CBS 115.81 / DSM 1491) TaxID=756982 RepID=G1X7L9_ARTOA|nr:hypothetical protein AOL_s00054g936 [Orbilia oligospora ATCC 24927]EGX50850.1 hypothetical protein AOL_s00054g936 [Orbilia oligospora ATCC 24927]
MATVKNRGVFRAQCISHNTTKDGLKSKLDSLLGEELEEFSLVHFQLVPACNRSQAQVAIFKYHPRIATRSPQVPSFLATPEPWFQLDGNDVFIDTDFYGLTQLFPVNPNDVKIDIVAISGLNSHAFGSWTSCSDVPENDKMWLSDFISKDEILKDCRVMTFGYDTKYRSKKQMWIEDHGDSFLTELDKARKTPKERDRPLVIIGHSFGGTIVTHAYVRSSEKTELEHIYKSITDIFLFGVPFRGINLDDVRSMVEEISDPTGQGEKMIEYIAYETSRHTTILDVFKNRIKKRGTRIFSFFETEKTPKVVKQEDGTFGRTRDLIIVVDRDSVKLGMEPLEKLFRAEGNHSTIVKLRSSQDPTYTTIQSYLRSTLEAAKYGVDQIQRNDIKHKQIRSSYGDDGNRVNSPYRFSHPALRELHITDPRLDKERIESTKGGLFDDSYKWILDNPDFKKWRNDDQYHILWISGDPGKGKTMLLCGIVNELERDNSATDGFYLSYFFCQGTDVRINNATAVLRGLIFSLILQDESLGSHIQQIYDQVGEGAFEGVNSWFRLSKVFDAILSDLVQEPTNTVYLIIDALDECVSDLGKLLDLISKFVSTSSSPQIKWIVSSRNWSDIERKLALPASIGGSRLSLELNSSLVSRAVEAYIGDQVLKLWPSERDEEFRNQVCKQLIKQADGTFLWVSLVMKDLEELQGAYQYKKTVLKKLREIPSGLPQLYGLMMQKIKSLRGENPRLCLVILSTMAIAYRPLQLAELTALTELESDPTEPDMIEALVKDCGSFLTVRQNTIYFVHQSAKDFLLEENSFANFFSGRPKYIHYSMFSYSLQAMSKSLRKNIYSLPRPEFEVNNDLKIPELDPLASVRYSCTHWVGHFLEGNYGDNCFSNNDDYHTILNFLQKHFLHWVEALSLMGMSAEGLKMIESLLFMCKVSQPQRLKFTAPLAAKLAKYFKNLAGTLPSFIYDAKRFIMMHQSIIGRMPLQLYSSCLLFSPKQSVIRQQNWGEVSPWVNNTRAIQENWNLCLQVFDDGIVCSQPGPGLEARPVRGLDSRSSKPHGEPRFVTVVFFSPDGKLLAFQKQVQMEMGSDGFGESCRLWDVSMGSLQAEIPLGKVHKPQDAIISPDGRLLASIFHSRIGYGLGSIALWNTDTGALHTELPETGSRVGFSPDSKFLAYFSQTNDRRAIKLWNIATKSLHAELAVNFRYPSQFTFIVPPDGKFLALLKCESFSHIHYTIQVLSTDNGALRAEMTAFSLLGEPVFAFSSDGRLLAYVSSQSIITLWDVIMETSRGELKDSSWIESFSISPSNELLACCLGNHTISLWNLATRTLQARFQDHNASIISISFSPDSALLASSSTDGTLKVWDTSAKALHTELAIGKNTYSYLTSCALGPDGTLVASCFASGFISGKFWLRNTGLSTVFQVPDCEFEVDYIAGYLFLSPNNRFLMSSRSSYVTNVNIYGNAINLWNTNGSFHTRLLLGESIYCDPSVAVTIAITNPFSPDSTLIAFVSYGYSEDRIAVWRTATGALHTQFTIDAIRIPKFQGTYLSFSPNSELLAFHMHNELPLFVWDIVTKSLRIKFTGGYYNHLAFSHNSKFLAFSSGSGTWLENGLAPRLERKTTAIEVWDLGTGALQAKFAHHTEDDTLTSIYFSTISMLLAASLFTVSSGSIISLWDALTGDLKVRVGSHTGKVDCMFLSPDDRLLISCSKGDSTIKFWDVAPASQGNSHPRGPLRFLTLPPMFRLYDIRVNFKTRAITLLLQLGQTFFVQF